jgi:hypothetical protein
MRLLDCTPNPEGIFFVGSFVNDFLERKYRKHYEQPACSVGKFDRRILIFLRVLTQMLNKARGGLERSRKVCSIFFLDDFGVVKKIAESMITIDSVQYLVRAVRQCKYGDGIAIVEPQGDSRLKLRPGRIKFRDLNGLFGKWH